MKRYTLALAAATPMPVQVMGEFFLLDAAPLGGVRVEFFGTSGLRRDEVIEDGLESMYARIEHGFTSIKLTSTLAQSVSFYVARGSVGVNRFSGSSDVTDRAARLLGVVDVSSASERDILFGDEEAASGNAFARGHTLAAAVGNNGHHQLKNPAASGRVVLLDSMRVFATGANQRFQHGRRDADIATLVGTFYNKNVGGAASVAQLRTQDNAGTLLTEVHAWQSSLAAVEVPPIEFSPPVRLSAGQGYCVNGAAVNVDSFVSWQFREYVG